MNGWKTTAIIFMILFLLETSFFIWAVWYAGAEEEKDNICAYDICEEYPQATRDGNICYCQDYDLLGNSQVVKTELMK